MKHIPIIILSLVLLALVGIYFYYRQDNAPAPKIEVVVQEIRTPQKQEVKPLYVDPKYECKGCKN